MYHNGIKITYIGYKKAYQDNEKLDKMYTYISGQPCLRIFQFQEKRLINGLLRSHVSPKLNINKYIVIFFVIKQQSI